MQDSQSQAHHLEILASRRRRDVSWLGSDIIDNALLQPWDQEMRSLVDNRVLDSSKSVEDDCASTTLNIVDGSLCERRTDGQRNSVFGEVLKCLCHLVDLTLLE